MFQLSVSSYPRTHPRRRPRAQHEGVTEVRKGTLEFGEAEAAGAFGPETREEASL